MCGLNETVHVNNLNYIENSKLISSKQSANSLFNFMSKIDYLKLILKNKAFVPRYNEEIIDYVGIKDTKKIAFPMTCFCDIHVQKIKYHCNIYGNIGIGMSKVWGVEKGIQPIQYLNDKSRLFCELSRLLKKARQNEDSCIEYKDYLLEHLLYIKPLQGEMIKNGVYIKKNFHDEREWRYVPIIEEKTGMPEIIALDIFLNQSSYNFFSKLNKTYKKSWLRFEYRDIKYLFINNEEDNIELINFIVDELDILDEEKYILISKILELDSIKEDV